MDSGFFFFSSILSSLGGFWYQCHPSARRSKKEAAEGVISNCQLALKIDPLMALKIDPSGL